MATLKNNIDSFVDDNIYKLNKLIKSHLNHQTFKEAIKDIDGYYLNMGKPLPEDTRKLTIIKLMTEKMVKHEEFDFFLYNGVRL